MTAYELRYTLCIFIDMAAIGREPMQTFFTAPSLTAAIEYIEEAYLPFVTGDSVERGTNEYAEQESLYDLDASLLVAVMGDGYWIDPDSLERI